MHDATRPDAHALQDVRILAIAPTPTHPTTAGNRARFRGLLERLQGQGATVRLLHVNHEPGDLHAMQANWSGGAMQLPFTLPTPRHARWNRVARRGRKYLGLPLEPRVDVDDWYDPQMTAPIVAEVQAFRPQAVLMMYYWFSAVLAHLPRDVRTVLDAQDVFVDRDARMRAAGIAQSWYSVPAREEARGLDRFDVILGIQEHESRHYRSLSRVPVVTVGHFLPLVDTGPVPATADLLIIGSDNDVNVHGVRWFLDTVWPVVHARRPDAVLRLVGRIGDRIDARPGVERCGVAADLAPWYTRSAMVINPLQGGTGLKIKGAEALGAGRVVISTPIAALGLEDAFDDGIVVCDTATAMQDAILALLGDHARLVALSTAARAFAEAWNARYEHQFDEVFRSLHPSVRTTGDAPAATTHAGSASDRRDRPTATPSRLP